MNVHQTPVMQVRFVIREDRPAPSERRGPANLRRAAPRSRQGLAMLAALLLASQAVWLLAAESDLEQAREHQRKREFASAMAAYDRVISTEQASVEVFSNRGLCCEALDRRDDAIRDYTRALSLQPNNAALLVSRGLCLMDQREYDQAIGDLDRAISADPRNAMAILARGVCRQKSGQLAAAKTDVASALQMDSKCRWDLLRRGLAKDARTTVLDGGEFLSELRGNNDLQVRRSRTEWLLYLDMKTSMYWDGNLERWRWYPETAFDRQYREGLQREVEDLNRSIEARKRDRAAKAPRPEIAAIPVEKAVQGTWLAFSAMVDGTTVDLLGKKTITASFEGDHCSLTLDGQPLLQMRIEMPGETRVAAPRDASVPRRWGHFDATIGGMASAKGWYLYQPCVSPTGCEFFAFRIGVSVGRRIGQYDLTNDDRHGRASQEGVMQFAMLRGEYGRLTDRALSPVVTAIEAEATPDDLKHMQGSWRLASVDGRELRDTVIHEFRDNRMLRRITFRNAPPGAEKEATIEYGMTLRPQADPKELDFSIMLQKQLGIYRFEGERLIMCVGGVGEPRPRVFQPDRQTRAQLRVYEREGK